MGFRKAKCLFWTWDSPKVNVWCVLMHNRVIGPFFFCKRTITVNIYLDMLEQYVAPQLNDFAAFRDFPARWSSPHWGLNVWKFLDAIFPDGWIGRGGPTPWPPRSPDITPLDFFLWGYVKDRVYATQVPDLETLKRRITEAIANVTTEMLQNTGVNLIFAWTHYEWKWVQMWNYVDLSTKTLWVSLSFDIKLVSVTVIDTL